MEESLNVFASRKELWQSRINAYRTSGLFFASTFSKKLQNIFADCCNYILQKVAAMVWGLCRPQI